MSKIIDALFVVLVAAMFAGGADASTLYSLTSAEADQFARYSGGHSFWIPGISTDLDFTTPGVLEVDANEWRIHGQVEDGDIAFQVDLRYSLITNQNPNLKLELLPEAYLANGGPVDPTSWLFAGNVVGTLTGVAGSRYAGAVIQATDRGPSAQFGFGANGKNVGLGLSNWFDFNVLSLGTGQSLNESYTGDINVNAVPEPSAALVFGFGALLMGRGLRR